MRNRKKDRFKPNSKETCQEDYKVFVGECLLLETFGPRGALSVKLMCDGMMWKKGLKPTTLDHSPIMGAIDELEKEEDRQKTTLANQAKA